MHIDICTLFPEFVRSIREYSIVSRAVESGSLEIGIEDIRDHGRGSYRQVDDAPYGGGPGMILMYKPVAESVASCLSHGGPGHVILFTPQGRRMDQARVRQLSQMDHVVCICGHYRGIDQRVHDSLVDEELSIGDYVLTGGELAAMVLVDSIARLLPGAVHDPQSVKLDSLEGNLLDHPHYTRPQEVDGMEVPAVLLSGNHDEISKWRNKTAIASTKHKRPDLFAGRREIK